MGTPATNGIVPVRANAILLAAGAYDVLATATPVSVKGASEIELFADYTRGAQNGAFKIQVWGSKDGISYYLRTILDGTTLTAGVVKAYGFEAQFPALTGAVTPTTQALSFVVDARRVEWLKVLAAEVGVVGTPGNLTLGGALEA